MNRFWNPPPSDGTGPYTNTLAEGSDTTETGALLMQLSPHKEALTDACVTEIFRAMSDPNDVLYESELGELVNHQADNDQTIPVKKPPKKGGETSSTKENQSTSGAKTAKLIMAKLAELNDAEDGQIEDSHLR